MVISGDIKYLQLKTREQRWPFELLDVTEKFIVKTWIEFSTFSQLN